HALLMSVGNAGLARQWPFVSIALWEQAERDASGPSRSALLTEVYVRRAQALEASGDHARALADLAAGAEQLQRVTDPQVQARATADLSSTRADVMSPYDPSESLRSAHQALA